MVTVNCQNCTKEFNAKPSWIKNGYGKFCSRECGHIANRTGKLINCSICSKEVYKQGKALKGSKSGKFFCSKSCQTKWRNSEFIAERHPNWKGGLHAYRRIKRQSGDLQVCTLCQIDDKRVLAVHHLDQNRKNNTIENLAWLCHNCHHLVHHYKEGRGSLMAAMV